MNPLIIAALISASAAGFVAWQVQSWRYDAKEKHRVEEQAAHDIAAQRELRALENRRQTAAAAAQAAAVGRGIDLRRAADGSRLALVGLSHAADQALREASASHDACIVRVTTASELLTQCAAEYRGLGEKASRHVSDIQTLTDTWPRE